MNNFIVLTLLASVSSCVLNQSEGPQDITMKRGVADASGQNPDAPIVLDYKQRINWEDFFQPSPDTKEQTRLRAKLSLGNLSEDPQELLNQARGFIAIGQFTQADSRLKAALAKNPNNPEILLSLAELNLRRHRLDLCREHLALTKIALDQQTTKNHDLIFRYRYILAAHKIAQNNVPEGQKILRDLLRLDSQFAPGYVALAESYLERKKPELAIFVAKRGIDRAGIQSSLLAVIGVAEHNMGQLDLAGADLRKALSLDEQNLAAAVGLVNVLLDSGDKEAAEALAKRAANLVPSDHAIMFALARAQARLGQLETAKQTYERILASDGESIKARFLLAELLSERLDQRAKALDLFNEVAQDGDSEYGRVATARIEQLKSRGL